MTTPTPHDKRVWHLKQVLDWPQRKIADEVGISQTTVNRILGRLEDDPPTAEEMAAFVASHTPPNGMPAIGSGRRVVLASPIWYAIAIGVVMLALSFAAVLFAAAISLLSHQKGDPGAAGPSGPPGKPRPVVLCVAHDRATGHLTKIYAQKGGSCGNDVTVTIP